MVAITIDVRGARDVILQTRRLRHWKVGLHEPLAALLKRQHERRINEEKTAPDGRPWEPLKAATIAKKRARNSSDPNSILIDTRAMAGNFRVSARGDIIRLTNRTPYAIHHMEGTRFMVARPFLGISNPNVNEIRRLVERHIARVLSNNLGVLTGR